MSLKKFLRFLLAGSLVLLLPAVASAHIGAVSVYALTNKGRILQGFRGGWAEVDNDPNALYLHGARSTLFKIRADGQILGREVGYGGDLWGNWEALGGPDANIGLASF